MLSELGKPRLLVSRRLPETVLPRMQARFDLTLHGSEEAMPRAALEATARTADALLIVAMDRIDRSFIEAPPDGIKVIPTLSVGHDHIDVAAAKARGITVLFTPDILSRALAEMGMLLMLGVARRVREGTFCCAAARGVAGTRRSFSDAN